MTPTTQKDLIAQLRLRNIIELVRLDPVSLERVRCAARQTDGDLLAIIDNVRTDRGLGAETAYWRER